MENTIGKKDSYAAPDSLGLSHIIGNLGKQGYETLEREQDDIEREARCEKKEKDKDGGGETQTLTRNGGASL